MSAQTQIPILDLKPQIESLWPELQAAFERVMKSGHFIMGPEVKAFEEEAAAYLGVKHAIGLNSGTDALYIALRALGVGPGDEVITTPFTFFATAEAISHVGAMPVFVDIEEDSFNIDPDLIEAAITARTKAIIPVHLFGRPCDMDRILAIADRHGLKVVEDCAQSFGAKWKGRHTGSMGIFGCYSFFPTKNLSAFGDGGMMVTNDEELAATARMLRVHGSRKKYFNETVGYNSRIDELHAAMLRVKLPHIDIWNTARRRAADRYKGLLENVPRLISPEVIHGHVFHQYSVLIPEDRQDEVQTSLQESGISTMVYYPVPCHKLKLYQDSHAVVTCPVAEATSQKILSLPIWPEITEEIQRRIAFAIRRCL
ncbi:DegT/DnrJ/EryC1/StrS aminotransferase family protein [Geothrix sp. 21YS21S-4]|uniref:DegT/DnrJ/EryC1/StrS family aminotransferase n=1 Tax=Geothrix sp. 21YS21S-4 TaxID=3068889 RepID=UPI0027BABB6F|nr:DegT/DnrJ/EryC1/StrS family aminotransferase [Geothrix sp. 21YS21S-4]